MIKSLFLLNSLCYNYKILKLVVFNFHTEIIEEKKS